MRFPRRLAVLAVVPAFALAACGGAPSRATSLVSTAPLGRADVSTVAPGPSATSPATPATTGAPAATVVAGPATTAATSPTASASAPSGATPTTAAVRPTVPASASPLEARVAAIYAKLNYDLTGPEATCLAKATDPSVLAAVEAGGDAALVGKVAGGLVQALAACEPQSFVTEQDQITMEDYAVDATQARCVTKALDAAAVADPVVAQAYFEGTTTLPPTTQQLLIDKLTPCVGAAKARAIITT